MFLQSKIQHVENKFIPKQFIKLFCKNTQRQYKFNRKAYKNIYTVI